MKFTPTPEAVEAVAKACHKAYIESSRWLTDFEEGREEWEVEARAAIAAFVEAEGFRTEELAIPSPAYFDEFSATDYEIGPPYMRLVGPWRKRD